MLSSLVYFFRLIFYVTFDFYKGIKATPYYFLLVVKQNTVDQIKLTTFNHVLAVFILLLSSLATAIFFNWLLTYNVIPFEYTFELSGVELSLLKLANVYSSYYIYFYYIYTLLFILTILIMWRKNIIAVESSLAVIYFFLLLLI